MNAVFHKPVLAGEILTFLDSAAAGEKGPVILDGTFGLAGHTISFLKQYPQAAVHSFDQDPSMIQLAVQKLEENGIAYRYADSPVVSADLLYDPGVTIHHLNFAAASERFGKECFHFILLDLGVSMVHFQNAQRGFSLKDETLDMRMNPKEGNSAADVVNTMKESELADVIYRYGEERKSRRIAKAIVANRPVQSAEQLASVVKACFVPQRMKIHPATKTFQALRIYVNNEIGSLHRALETMPQLLAVNGLFCVISFHSLEDRPVKKYFRYLAGKDSLPEGFAQKSDAFVYQLETKKPVVASEQEIQQNRASRSAKLRALRRLS